MGFGGYQTQPVRSGIAAEVSEHARDVGGANDGGVEAVGTCLAESVLDGVDVGRDPGKAHLEPEDFGSMLQVHG